MSWLDPKGVEIMIAWTGRSAPPLWNLATEAQEYVEEAYQRHKGWTTETSRQALERFGGPERFLWEVQQACRNLRDGQTFRIGQDAGQYLTDYEVANGVVYSHTRHAGTCSPDSPCSRSAPVEQAWRLIPVLERLMKDAQHFVQIMQAKGGA